MHPFLPPEKFDALAVIRQNKLEFSIGCAVGAVAPFALKYILAAFLIASILTGGQ